jgi:hypothetical protein
MIKYKSVSSPKEQLSEKDDKVLSMRTPRQRGGIVKIEERRFTASCLRELYDQVLRFLDDEGLLERLRLYMPIRTSNKRYLLAANPYHPSGDDFRRPVQYVGYFMESHKNWEDGINHLRKMLDLCGLGAEYVG